MIRESSGHVQYCFIGQREPECSNLALIVQFQCSQHLLIPGLQEKHSEYLCDPCLIFQTPFKLLHYKSAFCTPRVFFFKEQFFLQLCTK